MADTLALASKLTARPSRVGDGCPSGTRLCVVQRRQNGEQHVGIRAVSERAPSVDAAVMPGGPAGSSMSSMRNEGESEMVR